MEFGILVLLTSRSFCLIWDCIFSFSKYYIEEHKPMTSAKALALLINVICFILLLVIDGKGRRNS